jgi:glutaconate CoA-transferase subunit B
VLRRGHPSKVITPKAIFRFDPAKGLLKLDTIHAPYTLEHVAENTGFDLRVTGAAPQTPPPTAEELRVLRQVVRRKMIETGTYPDWAAKQLGGGEALSA